MNENEEKLEHQFNINLDVLAFKTNYQLESFLLKEPLKGRVDYTSTHSQRGRFLGGVLFIGFSYLFVCILIFIKLQINMIRVWHKCPTQWLTIPEMDPQRISRSILFIPLLPSRFTVANCVTSLNARWLWWWIGG